MQITVRQVLSLIVYGEYVAIRFGDNEDACFEFDNSEIVSQLFGDYVVDTIYPSKGKDGGECIVINVKMNNIPVKATA